MPKCDHCGEQCELPFYCSYCGGSYCSDHRFPPSHNCINEASWRNRTTGSKSNNAPREEKSTLPIKKCFFNDCEVQTSKIFYCPLCGQDFCEKHKLHQVHHYVPNEKPIQPESKPPRPESSIPRAVGRSSKGLNKSYIAMVFLIIAAVIILAFFVLNLNSLKAGFEKKVYSLPETGTIITGEKQFGDINDPDFFELRYIGIDNKEDSYEVVVVVTYTGSKNAIVGYFIRNGTGIGIPLREGNYDLYIHTGQNWNPTTKKFERNPTFNKWGGSFSFPPMVIGKNIVSRKIFIEKSHGYDIPVLGASRVSEENFPEL